MPLPPSTPPSAQQPTPPATALFATAAGKSGLLWVAHDDRPARPLWHVWSDGASLVVVGGDEQPAHGLPDAAEVRVSVRSSASGARLVTLRAAVERLAPGTEAWDAAAALLAAGRLNAAGGPDAAVARWREGSTLLRLVPGDEVLEDPWSPADDDGRHVPAPLAAAAPRDPRLRR